MNEITTIDVIGTIAAILGIAGSIYSAFNWYRFRKNEKVLNEVVTIRLLDDSTGEVRYELPFPLSRRQVTRAEVLGILGMIPTVKPGRFIIAHTNSTDYWRALKQVEAGDSDQIDVRLTTDERKGFAVPELSD